MFFQASITIDIKAPNIACRETRKREKIEAGIDAGELPPDTDAATWAAYVTTIIQGMSTLARDAASREKLARVAAAAMLAAVLTSGRRCAVA